MLDPQKSLKFLYQHMLEVSLGIATGPVLVGLMTIKAGEQWLQSLDIDEQSWWFNQQLPPLDQQTLQEREQALSARPLSVPTASDPETPEPQKPLSQ